MIIVQETFVRKPGNVSKLRDLQGLVIHLFHGFFQGFNSRSIVQRAEVFGSRGGHERVGEVLDLEGFFGIEINMLIISDLGLIPKNGARTEVAAARAGR